MSKLGQLIAELCPDGVPFVPLGEISQLVRGNGLPKKDFTESGVGYIDYRQIYTYYGLFADKTTSFVSPELAKTLKKVETNDIIITNTSKNVEDVCKPVVWLGKETIVTGGHATIIKHEQNAKYLAYFFQTEAFFRQKRKLATATNVIDVSASSLAKVIIPLPPLPVQDEIVRILDNFTGLTAELEAELTARKKQYEYYRDLLLKFEKRTTQSQTDRQTDRWVRWVTLGEIAADMYRGSGIKRDQVTGSGTPCVRYGELYTTYGVWFDKCVSYTNVSGKFFEHGDILFAITGESVDEIAKSTAYVGNELCLAGGDIVVMKHEQNPKYISYALSTVAAQKQKSSGKIKSKVVHSSIPALKSIVIPLPTIEEQDRIVAILDRFDALCNDLTHGLPAEIAARQKQYEYYRDKLLSFKNIADALNTIAQPPQSAICTTHAKIEQQLLPEVDNASEKELSARVRQLERQLALCEARIPSSRKRGERLMRRRGLRSIRARRRRTVYHLDENADRGFVSDWLRTNV